MSEYVEGLRAALAGAYRIEREIGAGGMATVFLASDLKHHRPVAVKVLRPELAAALGPERFLREIDIAARLDHPHILPLYDSGEADGFLYYVMPYAEGESLRDRLARERQLPLDDALQIAREVADALSYAHSRNLIHRDIKPENIMLSGGHARVADFGIARAITVAGGDHLTQTGMAVGTPAYMSPEQASGSTDLDGRSDLYSLGCMLYEMLGGQPPFTGPTTESVIHQHLMAEPPSITHLRPAVPPTVAAVLMRALAKTPADRFSPAAQFAEALRAGQPVTAMHAPLRRRWGLAIAGSVVGVVALLLAVRTLGFGSSDSLISTGALDERARIILADFENRSTDETHSATVTELMRIGLSQTPVVTILDPLQVVRTLELMRRDPSAGVPASVALEAAQREGVDGVITGEVTAVGSTFAIAARLLAPDGAVLTAQQETAATEEELVAAVDRLSAKLRERFGESLKSIESNAPLDRVTTGSMTALRLYSQGMQAWSQGDIPRAVQRFEDAVADDSTFAMAYRKLAIVLSNNDQQRTRQIMTATAAYRHRDRLTESERHKVVAAYHSVVTGNRDLVIQAYRSVLDLHPDDYLALNNLGVIYGQMRDLERAAEFYGRGLVADPTIRLHYSNLANVLGRMRQWDSAQVILNLYRDRFPDNPEMQIAFLLNAALKKDFPGAREMGDSLMRAQRGTVYWEAIAYEWFGSVSAVQGKLATGRQEWRRAFDITANQGLDGQYLLRAARRAMMETTLLGDHSAGQSVLDEAMMRFPLEGVAALDRPYGHLAMAYATVGRSSRARALLDEYRAADDADHAEVAEQWAVGAEAIIALNEELLDDALDALGRFDERNSCSTCARPWIARALERAGHVDSAMAVMEAFVNEPSYEIWYDAGHLAYGYRRLGEHYESKDQPATAVEYYGRFVDLWKDADATFQPQVEEIKQRIVRLGGDAPTRSN